MKIFSHHQDGIVDGRIFIKLRTKTSVAITKLVHDEIELRFESLQVSVVMARCPIPQEGIAVFSEPTETRVPRTQIIERHQTADNPASLLLGELMLRHE